MTPESIESLLSLAMGFAFAGLLASGYQAFTERPLGFALMHRPERAVAVASVPLLVFAAPFLIMRNSLRGGRIEKPTASFVAMATVVAGFWSLMSGTVVSSGVAELLRLLA